MRIIRQTSEQVELFADCLGFRLEEILFGLPFLIIGFFTFASSLSTEEAHSISSKLLETRLGSGVFSLAGGSIILQGLFRDYDARCVFNKVTNQVHVLRRSFVRKREVKHFLPSIGKVFVEHDSIPFWSSKSHKTFALYIKLRSGDRIFVSSEAMVDPTQYENVAVAIHQFLGMHYEV